MTPRLALVTLALLVSPGPGRAEAYHALPALPQPPVEASGAGGAIDPVAATEAYLALLPAAERARSDAYTEGGHWLLLWGFLWGAGACLLLLATGASARMRDRAERWFRRPALRTAACALQFFLAFAVLSVPLDVYQGFLREHRYGLSNMTLAAWLRDLAIADLLNAVIGAVLAVLVYAAVRRAPRTWWIWAAGAAAAVLALVILVTPVAITPLFNTQRRLDDPRVAAPIVAMARANGLAATDVWVVDESRQSRRISANVSGLFGAERISLNDNLLARGSLPEIEAILGHEIGHDVLGHAYTIVLELGLVLAAAFAAVAALLARLCARHGARWGVRGPADPAGLPLGMLLLTACLLVATPLVNGVTRVHEVQADLFGLNAARQPDGFARAALDVAEYRKLAPGPVEELLFYDHPSGRARILSAMRWKAEHPDTWAPPAAGARDAGSPRAP